MFEEISKELMNAKENLWRKQKFECLVIQSTEVLQKELDKKIELEKILQRDINDVKKLESLSITSMFYSILGSKHQQLEKERQELLSAKLKYDECCKSVMALESQLTSYKFALKDLFDADTKYEAVLKRKEELILKLNDENSQKLFLIMDKLAELKIQKKELEEAIDSGNTAKIELERVKKSLQSAESWGTWDLIGGGLVATAVKHSHIDEAKEYVHRAKISLTKFQNELSDVELESNIDINIGCFETFADYFFDGLISDWIVSSRIHESLDSVYCVEKNVDTIIITLRKKLKTVQMDLLSIEENIKLLIEQL